MKGPHKEIRKSEEKYKVLLGKDKIKTKDDLEILIDTSEEIVLSENGEEKKEDGEIIKINQQYLNEAIERCENCAFILDNHGRMKKLNKKMELILGYKKRDFDKISVRSIFPLTEKQTVSKHRSDLDHFKLIFCDRNKYNYSPAETSVLDKRKKLISFQVRAIELKNEKDELVNILFLLKDIRESKSKEKETRKKRDKLERLLEELGGLKIIEELKEDLKKAKDNVESVIESSIDGIIISDTSGFITRTNQALRKLLGYSQQELMGKHIAELNPLEGEDYLTTYGQKIKIGRDFLNRIREQIFKLFTKGEGYIEGYFVRKDKTLVPVVCSTYLIIDREGQRQETFNIVRDLTEIKKAYREVQEAKEYLENVISTAVDGIITVDPQGTIGRVNEAIEKMIGYTQEELKGMHISQLGVYDDDEHRRLRKDMVLNLVKDGRVTKYESIWKSKDGELISIEANAALLKDKEGEIIGGVVGVRDITERIKAEKQIKDARDFLEKVIETSIDGIMIQDAMGNTISMNNAMEKISGYKREELIQKHISQIRYSPEERKDVNHEMLEKLFKEGSVIFDGIIKRKDGSPLDVGVSCSMVKDEGGNNLAGISIYRDISDRKKAEKELRETKNFLEKVIETSSEGIIVNDIKGNILSINSAVEKITGYSKEELIGKHFSELNIYKDKASRKKIREMILTTLFEEGSASFDAAYRRKDGNLAHIEYGCALIRDEAGEYIGGVSIIHDVTEKRKAEKAIEEANHYRNEFFTNISHEFRTPLTLAMGPIEGILRGESGRISCGVKDQLSLALKNSRQLLRLINQLLEFSRLESGSQSLIYEKRNLKEFIARVLDSFSFIAQRKKINLTFNPGNNGNEAYIDPAKVEKVLFNLIGNAFKFTLEGGSISVGIEKDNGSGSKENGDVKISVKDTGIGIKKGDLKHIFDRFRQANGGSAREYGGTGIGLALSKELVELMGGTIEVESAYGKGSTFFIYLPVGKDGVKMQSKTLNGCKEILLSQPEIELSDLDDQGKDVLEESISGKKPLILIIDDNPDVRKYLSGILKKDYDIYTAQNGLEGLKRLDENQPDLILCDIMMPKMDGYAFLKRVKSHLKYRQIPLIFLTAKADPEMKIEGLEEGADDYIVKPFNSLELLARIRSSLRIRELMRENTAKEKKIVNLTHKLEEKYQYGNIVGKSKPMRKIYQLIDSTKDSDSTILLLGETGTGKEVIANAIHYNSPRKDCPFVAVNCGAIPKKLMEREFFGHLKGAYTGAHQGKKGYFEEADGGTLFLDEIGELDKELQVKLLRALESGEITRVGDSEPTKVDVRLIAASNKDLRSEVRAGNFREDLYYRIYVIPIHIPPLRERREDIPLLIEHFRKKLHTKLKKEIPSFSEETMRRFINYAYPGNVRELEHIIERVCFLGSDDKNLFNDQTEGSDRLLSDSLYNDFLSSTNPLKNAVTRAERDIITYTLKIYDNDHNQTAKKLNIGISSLYRKIKEYGMNG